MSSKIHQTRIKASNLLHKEQGTFFNLVLGLRNLKQAALYFVQHRMKHVQGWSRQNWFGGILIIVSLHIHFNKLLMPFSLVAASPIRCKVYNFHLRL